MTCFTVTNKDDSLVFQAKNDSFILIDIMKAESAIYK